MTRQRCPDDNLELSRLRAENLRLQELNRHSFDYIRTKVNELLEVIGTRTLRPEELDDEALLSFDPIGIVATSFRHILENTRATNRQLLNAHREIEAIFDTVGSALIVVDPQRKVVSFNRQASRILLKHDGDVCGEYCSQVLCGSEPAQEECVFLQVMSSGREATFRGKPLRERFFDVIAAPIFNVDEEITHVVMAYHDVTEARHVEEMKSEFVSTAAHELRTPLATIMGYTDLILSNREETREKLYDYLELILGRAEHLSHIVSDLLDISRIESGEALKMIFRPCHLDLLCREVASAHADGSGRHEIVLELPAKGAVVEGDRYALTQVIENLVGNAIKYSPHGGTIRVAISPGDDCYEICISDQGIGMSDAQLEHIFEKFYRAHSGDSSIPGTGLGMTIVKHLVDAHHGQVAISSTPGVGTSVRIKLPRTQPGL